MKHLTKFSILLFLAFFSCTQQVEDGWESNELPQESQTHPVDVCFSRASLETFAEQGITEIGIYAYLKDSMVYGKNLPLNDGNLQIDLPLGENLQTFAVANADHLTDVDSLSKVVIYQDVYAQKQVYISNVLDLISDYSTANLDLELKRLVGQATFQPKETIDEINAITRFDQLNVTFTNVGVAYKVKTGECIQQDITISVDRAAGFSASVYSFPTVDADSRTSVDVVYLKGEEEINRTNSPLDTGIAFEPSKHSIVNMPILDDAYLQDAWTRSRTQRNIELLPQPFTIEESEF